MVTAADPDGGYAGLTVGSFTSVSLDPPLVAFLPCSVIHNDANDFNVIVRDDGDLYANRQRVAGIIDFGFAKVPVEKFDGKATQDPSRRATPLAPARSVR